MQVIHLVHESIRIYKYEKLRPRKKMLPEKIVWKTGNYITPAAQNHFPVKNFFSN
jgi:hypothetical protein